jgi:hypothetical protein
MEDLVAVAVTLDDGSDVYFMTWGRIQEPVDPTQLEALVLSHASTFALGGRAVSARVCPSLQEAREQPYFFEAIFEFARDARGMFDDYDKWRSERSAAMDAGKDLYFLGRP